MNRVASYLLLFCFVCLGTGVANYVHDLQHEAEDAREDAADKAAGVPVESHHHDESNCQIHAQLHMPYVATGWVPVLVSLGLWVAFLTLPTRPVHSFKPAVRVDCRGPPVFISA